MAKRPKAKTRKGRPVKPVTEAQRQTIARGVRGFPKGRHQPGADLGNDETIVVRRSRALELRIAGLTFREVAAQLRTEGYQSSAGQACRDVGKALRRLEARQYADAAIMKTLELARLDSQTAKLWDQRGQPEVSNALVRVADRRAKLAGLDKPMQVHTVEDDLAARLHPLPAELLEEIEEYLTPEA